MFKVFVHDFNDTVSTLPHFERQVDDYIKKLNSDPKVVSFSSEIFFHEGRLIYIVYIDEWEN